MQRIVIKVGSSTLTAGTRNLSQRRIIDLVGQMARLHDRGHQVVLVSSGAMASGRESLGDPELPKFIPSKQMLAAVGQPRLMTIYTNFFAIYQLNVAQVLLTRLDLSDRRRYLNARNTLEALLSRGVIPVVNENDTVATEEIRVGDNDNLSALVSNLIEADLLLMLTDQKGVYTGDPDQDEDVEFVPALGDQPIPDWLWKAAGRGSSPLGTGGMFTKLEAAALARRSGTRVVITQGSLPEVILRAAEGEELGTSFEPLVSSLESRKRFILAGPQSEGVIVVDEGAENVLLKGRSSLLPVGVIRVKGDFQRGETVRVLNDRGQEIARGLANYDVHCMRKLRGHHSREIEDILGFTYGNELVHHDNMILV